MENTQPLKYCLYARKSSESDERQALSIDSQIKEMYEVVKANRLNIAMMRQESHSAKASGDRGEFNALISDIRSGACNAVLTWAPDRLSRNAGDLGTFVDLMDDGKLVEIRTPSQTFTNNPNEKFLLMILCSQAKLENDNLAKNIFARDEEQVRDGMEALHGTSGLPQSAIRSQGQQVSTVRPNPCAHHSGNVRESSV